jgi:hypothetical protein
LVPDLQVDLNSEFLQALKNGFIVTGAQQLEENVSLQKYEITFIIKFVGCGVNGYSTRNKKRGQNSWDILFFIIWQEKHKI